MYVCTHDVHGYIRSIRPPFPQIFPTNTLAEGILLNVGDQTGGGPIAEDRQDQIGDYYYGILFLQYQSDAESEGYRERKECEECIVERHALDFHPLGKLKMTASASW